MYKVIFSFMLLSAAHAPGPFNITKCLATAKNIEYLTRAAAQRCATAGMMHPTINANDRRESTESTPKSADPSNRNMSTDTYWQDNGATDGAFFKIFKFGYDQKK